MPLTTDGAGRSSHWPTNFMPEIVGIRPVETAAAAEQLVGAVHRPGAPKRLAGWRFGPYSTGGYADSKGRSPLNRMSHSLAGDTTDTHVFRDAAGESRERRPRAGESTPRSCSSHQTANC